MIELELPKIAVERDAAATSAGGPAGRRTVGTGPVVEDADDAFASWYRSEHPRLLAAMTVVTRDLHAAQDVTSEAFARALASWTRVSAMDSPTGWTYRVALNVARRRARRAALEQRVLRRMVPDESGLPLERSVELWDAVRALPPLRPHCNRAPLRRRPERSRSRHRNEHCGRHRVGNPFRSPQDTRNGFG